MYMHSSEIPKRFILDDTKKTPFTFKIIPNKISNFIKYKPLIFEEYMRHFFSSNQKEGKKCWHEKFQFSCSAKLHNALLRSQWYRVLFFFVQICVKILLELWNFSYNIIFDSIPYFSIRVNFNIINIHPVKKRLKSCYFSFALVDICFVSVFGKFFQIFKKK